MKNPPDALSQEFLGKLSDLKDNINQEFINNQVAESVDSIAKEIERTIESLSNDNRMQTMVLDNFLYDANISEEAVDSDKKSGVLHGLGAATWNVLDSALFSLPSIGYEAATGEKNPYDIMNNQTEGMATFGKVVGQGIGFLLPMKYIGLGLRV